MIDDIVVGKHTLESLTKGMYFDARIIFREYIQNSVDSIKEAIDKEILDKNDSEILITIEKEASKVVISDNGTGIPTNKAKKILLDIGNSTKNPDSSIGFRGIGRLAGLGYCDELIFVTSYKGEKIKTQISFNAKELEKLLIPGEYQDYDLLKVIDRVTNENKTKENIESHYFKVILKNVKNYDNILEYEDVKLFLSQIAPVPYNDKLFSWGNKIKKEFKKNDLYLDEYNIVLTDLKKREKIYKLYSDKFISDRKSKIQDEIEDVKIEIVKDKFNNVIAAIWYSVSKLHGTIVNKKKKGIRLKKGNFQIGDRFILNNIFKEDRFNGWFQGEIHTFNNKIIPNARRDNFEKNEEYYYLLDELKEIGEGLSREIRKQSRIRNKIKKEKQIFSELDVLIGKNKELKNKIIQLEDDIPLKEKKVLDRVLTILDKNYKKDVTKEKLFKIILNNY